MNPVTIEEAQAKLPELIMSLSKGEEVEDDSRGSGSRPDRG